MDDIKYKKALTHYNLHKDMGSWPEDSRAEFMAEYQKRVYPEIPDHVPAFILVELQRKLTMYFSSKAADALGAAHGISAEVVHKNFFDLGDAVEFMFVTRCSMTDASGRQRSFDSVGSCAVGKSKYYKGQKQDSPDFDGLTNAPMKAATKAWRRAVMTLCGTGMSTEDELHSIEGARRVS